MVGLGTGYQVLKRTLGAPVMADASYTDRIIDIAQKANIAKEGNTMLLPANAADLAGLLDAAGYKAAVDAA